MDIKNDISSLVEELKRGIEKEVSFRIPGEDGYFPHETDRIRSVERQYLKKNLAKQLEQILSKY